MLDLLPVRQWTFSKDDRETLGEEYEKLPTFRNKRIYFTEILGMNVNECVSSWIIKQI